MPELKPTYLHSHKNYRDWFSEVHADGALDAKAKALMHIALLLALHCEP
jgi:alkylhydroperoxidase/carboxymuconolactone decarboxylase family protein YurZ